MSCLAGKIFHSHNKILLSRDENNLLIDHSKFLKIFCDLYMYCSGSFFNIYMDSSMFIKSNGYYPKIILDGL